MLGAIDIEVFLCDERFRGVVRVPCVDSFLYEFLGSWPSLSQLSTQKEENPSTENQFMVQIHELQDKVNSLNDAK